MKKFLALLLALTLTGSLAACSQPADQNSDANNQSETTNSGETTPEGGDAENGDGKTYKIAVAIASFDNTFASFTIARHRAASCLWAIWTI